MATVYGRLDSVSTYRDSKSPFTYEEQLEQLRNSKTLYIGNLSFFTSEEQIYELFAKAGSVRRIIMGLDRNTKTPCGFCFVEYYNHSDALDALKYISGTKLDERVIRADLDPGYKDGRQYGRGRSGGQVRDEYRDDYDTGRGGWGKIKQAQHEEQYVGDVPAGEQSMRIDAEENPRFRDEEKDEEMGSNNVRHYLKRASYA